MQPLIHNVTSSYHEGWTDYRQRPMGKPTGRNVGDIPPGDGGAGNRTLVRVSIRNRVYAHRLDFLPFLPADIEPARR